MPMVQMFPMLLVLLCSLFSLYSQWALDPRIPHELHVFSMLLLLLLLKKILYPSYSSCLFFSFLFSKPAGHSPLPKCPCPQKLVPVVTPVDCSDRMHQSTAMLDIINHRMLGCDLKLEIDHTYDSPLSPHLRNACARLLVSETGM